MAAFYTGIPAVMPHLTCSDLWNNRLLNQKPKVVVELAGMPTITIWA